MPRQPITWSAFITTKRALSASCCATCLASTALVNCSSMHDALQACSAGRSRLLCMPWVNMVTTEGRSIHCSVLMQHGPKHVGALCMRLHFISTSVARLHSRTIQGLSKRTVLDSHGTDKAWQRVQDKSCKQISLSLLDAGRQRAKAATGRVTSVPKERWVMATSSTRMLNSFALFVRLSRICSRQPTPRSMHPQLVACSVGRAGAAWSSKQAVHSKPDQEKVAQTQSQQQQPFSARCGPAKEPAANCQGTCCCLPKLQAVTTSGTQAAHMFLQPQNMRRPVSLHQQALCMCIGRICCWAHHNSSPRGTPCLSASAAALHCTAPQPP